MFEKGGGRVLLHGIDDRNQTEIRLLSAEPGLILV